MVGYPRSSCFLRGSRERALFPITRPSGLPQPDSFPTDRAGSGRGRAVITASTAMEYAFEGEQLADDQGRRPSLFTAALTDGWIRPRASAGR
jgi:hypothetical protein